MAPLANEPRQVLTVLNLARRKALYTLLIEITAFMRSQLEFHEPSSNSDSNYAPLLIDPSAENSIIIPPTPTSGRGGRGGGSLSPDAAPPSPALVRIRAAAIEHFDAWRKDVLAKLKDVLAAPDDAKVVDDRRKRTERIAREKRERADSRAAGGRGGGGGGGGDLLGGWDAWPEDGNDKTVKDEAKEQEERAQAVARLQAHWHPIPTRFVTIPLEDRQETLSCVLLVLLSTGHYLAHSRALAVYLASALELPLEMVNAEEMEIARSLVEGSVEAARREQQQQQRGGMSAEAEAEKRKQQNQSSRYWKVGLASVAGAALIGVTGGLAAPVVAGAIGGIMGSVGLGGVASFLGIFWMNGALVGTLFGAMGARMTGEMVDQYAREVEDFKFIPLKDEWGTRGESQHNRRLRVTIGINGWLNSRDDVTKPWRALGDDSEAFALRYEMNSLLGLGKTLKDLVSSTAWNSVKVEILKRTVLATLWSALWPAYLLSMATAVDNPFNLAKNRSGKAGEILADALINKVQGERPVTLVGYSLGARVIYSCLRSLAARRAFGLVDSVVFIGAPVPSNKQHWQMMRTVVSGKMFNVYSQNDYLLAFLYRATSIQLGVAGLQEIKDIEGVENLNLSDEVQGHMRYAKIIPQILARCGIPVTGGADGQIGEDEDMIKLDDLDKDNNDMANLIDLDSLSVAENPRRSEPVPPPSYTPRPVAQPPRPRGIQRTTLTRATPSALAVDDDPLGLGLSEAPTRATPAPRPTARTASSAPVRPLVPTKQEPGPPRVAPVERLGTNHMMPVKADSSPPAFGAPSRATTSVPAPVPAISAPAPPLAAQPPISRAQTAPVPVSQPTGLPVFTSSHSQGPVNHSDDDDDDDDEEEGGWGIKMVDNDEDGLAYMDPSPIED